jgi:mRNA interferase MazF
MVNQRYIPERGDLVWLDFDPQTGHEQKGKRPALVISAKSYNRKTGLALLCPMTSKKKGYPFEVEINNDTIQGVLLSDQIKSMDWAQRNATFIAKVKKTELEEVLSKVSILLFEK